MEEYLTMILREMVDRYKLRATLPDRIEPEAPKAEPDE